MPQQQYIGMDWAFNSDGRREELVLCVLGRVPRQAVVYLPSSAWRREERPVPFGGALEDGRLSWWCVGGWSVGG